MSSVPFPSTVWAPLLMASMLRLTPYLPSASDTSDGVLRKLTEVTLVPQKK